MDPSHWEYGAYGRGEGFHWSRRRSDDAPLRHPDGESCPCPNAASYGGIYAMLTACPSHARQPPVSHPLNAYMAARILVRLYPEVIPEFMWETSHPSAACCTRGALAYSLMHAAVRQRLGKDKT